MQATVSSIRPPLLSMQQVTKRFGAVEAIIGADFDVHAREVVALVGDNGAGKSTLAKMVAGVFQPDAGMIELDGDLVSLSSPSVAYAHGVVTVFQDLALCDNLDVTANIFLGREIRHGPQMDLELMARRAREILHDLNALAQSTNGQVLANPPYLGASGVHTTPSLMAAPAAPSSGGVSPLFGTPTSSGVHPSVTNPAPASSGQAPRRGGYEESPPPTGGSGNTSAAGCPCRR